MHDSRFYILGGGGETILREAIYIGCCCGMKEYVNNSFTSTSFSQDLHGLFLTCILGLPRLLITSTPMSESNCSTIAAWLSELPDVSQTPVTSTNKRKRLDDHSGPPQTCGPLTDQALAEISPNLFNTPESSYSKGRNKKYKVSEM